MKKITTSLFLIAMFLFSGRIANAQLPDGCIGPDFTATDINGVTWNLYDILDEGKTVFMDISATWCGPCWSYHNLHHLANLYNQYGPSGTDEVMVFFIEGDGNTSTQCLYQQGSCPTGTSSQGDWVTGTPYPIIDNATIANSQNYDISYFPTIYMITPDRIVRENSQISTSAHYQQMNQHRILAIGTADAGINFGCGMNTSLSACVGAGVNMSVRLFNYSTLPLTAATITVTVDGVLQQTIPWTGNLATYAHTTVNIPNVTGTLGAHNAVIEITGANGGADTRATNNTTTVPFTIFPSTGGQTVVEPFTAAAFPPAGWSVVNGGGSTTDTWVRSSTGYNSVGSTFINFYEISSGEIDELLLPAIDFTGFQTANVTFMRSHKRYSASYSDKLRVLASDDCGASWSQLYTKQGAQLASVTGYTGNTPWVPASAADWAADQVVLNSMLNQSSVIVRFEATSGYGNNLYLDDINVNLSVGLENIADYVQFSVYPNPATENLSVALNLKQDEKATIEIVNTLGEVVQSKVSDLSAGISSIDFDVKDLAAGSYFISVSTNEGKVVKPFMIQ